MLTFFSSLLPFVVVVTGGQFLQDWSIDTQTSDIASSGPVLKNGIPNTSGLALATADGSSEFAQPPPNRGDVVSSDGIVMQGGSGCSSNTITHPRRIRARDEMKCPTNLFRPNGEEEKERNLLHFTPDAQENGGGQNTGGSGDPERRLAIPPEDSKLPYLFIPEEDRPKENLELCPEATYPVPVCGNPRDTYVSSYLYPNQLIIDPCYRYIVLVGCLSIEGGRTGYCCKRAEVAYGYDDLKDGEIDIWQYILAGEGEMLWEIQKALMSGLSNPFKLVGLGCIPMGTVSGEQGLVAPF